MASIVEKPESADDSPDRSLSNDRCTLNRDQAARFTSVDTHGANRAAGKIPGQVWKHAKAGGPKGRRLKPRCKARLSRGLTLEIMAKEYIWLWDLRHGVSTEAIALREGVSAHRVRFGVARARAQEGSYPSETAIPPPRLVPFFPLGPFTPSSLCGHRRPIQSGSVFCCMVCHRSGIDEHPALKRDPLSDPAPEPKPASVLKKTARETRKQRRQRVFGTTRSCRNPDCNTNIV